MIHSVQGNLDMFNKWFYIRSYEGQKAVGWYIKTTERKRMVTKYYKQLYASNLDNLDDGKKSLHRGQV